MSIKPEHIIERNGKPFVLYAGLLAEAHALGLESLRVSIVQVPTAENGQRAICVAEAIMPDRTGDNPSHGPRIFSEVGDADPSNVNRGIALHMLRMAATRAKARALRDATNIGMTAFEELGEHDEDRPSLAAANGQPAKAGASSLPCHDCGEYITSYTLDNGKILDFHQVIKIALKRYNLNLCGRCMVDRKEALAVVDQKETAVTI